MAKHRFIGGLLTAIAVNCSMDAAADGHPSYLTRPMPQEWEYTEHFSQQLPTDDSWWRSFDDSVLDSLIGLGIDGNYDLRMASRRVEIANNMLGRVRSGFFPVIGVSASYNKARNSGDVVAAHGRPVNESFFSFGANMQWEIDVFGKIASQAKSKDALYKASKAEYAAAMVSMCGKIATSYMQLRVWQAQLALARQHVASQSKIVDITVARKDAGIASMLDVTQAKVVLYSTEATIPVLENSIATGLNALSVLVGRYPDEIERLVGNGDSLPDYRQIVATGIPTELLRRRPDLVEAEMNLASTAALIGVAKKDFLPTLTLTGSIGTEAHNFNDVFSKDSYYYSIVPTLSWTIFDGFQRKYDLSTARLQMETAIDNYNLAVMTAVEETDNAMSSYLSSLRHIDMLESVVGQCEKSLDLSVDLYKQGLTPFSNVVDAQMNLLEYQNSYISAKGGALTSLIDLYEALGGGWNN